MFTLVLALGLDFISDSGGAIEIHVPHKWSTVITQASFYEALALEPKVVQQEGQSSCTNSKSAFCFMPHFSICDYLLSVMPQELCYDNRVKWTGRDMNPKQSVNIPKQCNYARSNVETPHLGYLFYLTGICINIPNALLHIERETV